MVNAATKFECLRGASLQARHFANDLGLEGSRLQTVLRFASLEPTDRISGKWRTFSPFEVLTIATLVRIKDVTDLAIVRHPVLVEYLSDPSKFGAQSIAIWSDGLSPALVTDFKSIHRVIAVEFAAASFAELLQSNLVALLRLTPIVVFLLRAIKVGGNDEQMALVKLLETNRQNALSNAAERDHQQQANQLPSQYQDPAVPGRRLMNLEDRKSGDE